MERKKTSPNVYVDRISSFPEPLLHHILSFLRTEHVAQTSVLSKTWKHVWHTYPTIYFRLYSSTLSRQKRVLKGLEQTLLNRHMNAIGLKKLMLSLHFSDDPKFASNINRCLIYAIASNVEKLYLYFDYMKYCLPQIVYYAKSIVVLELEYCKLDSPTRNVTLSSLRELGLFKCAANDEAIRDIVAGCPLIERLKIIDCRGLKSLEFLNLGKLSKFMVRNEDRLARVSICGPNVRLVDISSLHAPCGINVALCKNLKEFKLFKISITNEWLCNQFSELPFLEYVEIFRCMKIRKLLVRSCNTLDEFKLDTPNLSVFDYEGDMVSFSSNALALSETILTSLSLFFFPLKNFLKAAIVPRELREILSSPLTYENHVCFIINSEYNTFSLAKLLDSLLWISPHAETLSIKLVKIKSQPKKLRIISENFSYKKPHIYEGGTRHCCRSLPLSCWQHCIREVKIEDCREYQSEACIDTQSFSSENGEIMEKIDDLWRLFLESDDKDG
ncbi:hypothetical protein CUMW_259840 [Citrus unshiu]|uniref:F-box domain-containing protein n=1 Tax=Citrus unshiu TaxID=55188 RepID=A0A2H5QTB9_CITUN|nr:hypothetical protein CUMW_259840 [Citrus unshiu]